MSSKKLTHEEIRAKMAIARQMDFSRWTPRQVARHLISAGKQRYCKEPPYDFPGYYKFPYYIYKNAWVDQQIILQLNRIFNQLFRNFDSFPSCFSDQTEENIPFKYSDDDAVLQFEFLMLGEVAFLEVQSEYHQYAVEMIDLYVHTSMIINSE